MSAIHVEWRDRVAHLVFDDPARKVNVIDAAALASLEHALAELERNRELAGVVVRSGKPGSFVAGADVQTIAALTDPAAVEAIVRRAQAAFERLAALPCPSVAAIDGACLGGGTELALACDSRIATDEPHTRIGLPETQLGILPGFGGTTRLPRLVGLSAALDLILSGRILDARRAVRMGLVAAAVPSAWLLEHAHERLQALARRPADRRRDRFRPRGIMQRLLDGTPFGRALALSQARATVQKRTAGHYPAPLAVLRVIEHGHGQPLERGFELEAREVGALVVSPECKNLVRIFLLSERAKKEPLPAPPAPVRTLVVAGAGVMGAGIVELATRQGLRVRMRDVTPEAVTRGLHTIRGLIDERVRRRRATRTEAGAQLARLLPALDLQGLGRADAAIEAVVEDLDVKRRVFAELEVRMRPDALLATNTSSLPVTALAGGLEHPERCCGFHFFNPVHRMPLVEVVRGERTSDAALATAVALARTLGKTPVVVADAPGFVVNRVLMPYLREALHLVEEGFRVADVDRAMRAFGMPMGPFEVVDEVGLDVAAKVATVLARAFPDRMSEAPALAAMVAAGRLGRKNGVGFYRHRGSRRELDPRVPAIIGVRPRRSPERLEPLAERMALVMVNESARCLEDGVVADAGMLDLALVFGAGFPPFRGGPLRWADAQGVAKVEARLGALRAEKGDRFRPAPLLARLAAAGASFTAPPAPEPLAAVAAS